MSYLTVVDPYDYIDTSVPPINLSGRQHYFHPSPTLYKRLPYPSATRLFNTSQAVYPATLYPTPLVQSSGMVPSAFSFQKYGGPTEPYLPQLNPFDVVKDLFFEKKNTVKPKHYTRPKMREKGTDPVRDQQNVIEITPNNENHDPFDIIPAVPNEDVKLFLYNLYLWI